MRRRPGLALAIAAAIVLLAVVAVTRSGSDAEDRYRVDAVFDVARGIGPGQLVKIAGAEVGSIEGARITADNKARVEMSVDRRFAPFRADASCAIRPEGLISENFVECRPGTAARAALRGSAGGTPTVPVEQTSAPVTLQDLFDVWSVPTADRLSVLLGELGLGLIGRGDDLNAVLRRANPSLEAMRRAIALVNRQRGQLQRIVRRADPIVGELSRRSGDVQRFVEQTDALTAVTGPRDGELRAAIRRLPPLLRSARPALAELDRTAEAAVPLLAELRRAGPAVTPSLDRVRDVAPTAVRTLRALDRPAERARRALTGAEPVLRELAAFATDADPAGRDLARLLVSLRDAGGIESLLRGAYNTAGVTNSYDATSHVLLGNVSVNQCVAYARQPTPGCDAHLDGRSGDPQPRRREPRAPRLTPKPAPVAEPSPSPRAEPAPAAPSVPSPPAPPSLVPRLPEIPVPGLPDLGEQLESLLELLLG